MGIFNDSPETSRCVSAPTVNSNSPVTMRVVMACGCLGVGVFSVGGGLAYSIVFVRSLCFECLHETYPYCCGFLFLCELLKKQGTDYHSVREQASNEGDFVGIRLICFDFNQIILAGLFTT